MIAVIGFFFALPVYALSLSSSMKYEYDMLIKGALVHLAYRDYVFGCSNSFMLPLIIFLATVFAVSAFGYLFSKTQCDFYHGLPVKRNDLFAANYFSSVISFVVTYSLLLMFAVIIGIGSKLLYLSDLGIVLSVWLVNCIGFILIYSFAVFFLLLTGKTAVAGLAIFIIYTYGYAFYGVWQSYESMFYNTFTYLGNSEMPAWLSPIGLADDLMHFSGQAYNETVSISKFVICIFVIAVLFAASIFVYNKRNLEKAGTAVVFDKIQGFIEVAILIPAAMLGGNMAYDMTNHSQYLYKAGNVDGEAMAWFVFGIVITIVLGHFIIQAIYFLDFKSLFKNLLYPVVALVLTAGICCFFMQDLGGYDRYLPGDDVESMAVISYTLLPSNNYFDFERQPELGDDGMQWKEQSDFILENMKLEDKAFNQEFVKAAIVQNEEYARNIDYITSDECKEVWYNIDVCFNLKNGKKKYRNYSVNRDAFMEEYNKLYCQEEYKAGIYEILNENVALPGDSLVLGDPLQEYVLGSMEDEFSKKLLEIYRKEFLAQDAYDTANSVPVGKLFIRRDVVNTSYARDDMKNMSYGENHVDFAQAYIYPSFTETIKLLEDSGYDLNKCRDINGIQSVVVTEYDYEKIDSEDYMKVTEYDQKEDILKVLEGAYPEEYIWVDGCFHEVADMDISVNYNFAFKDGNTSILFRKEK